MAAALATAWLCAPVAEAGHCRYCNAGLPTRVQLSTPEIGTDGVAVLALLDNGQGAGDPQWNIVTVTVHDAAGAPVEGALEVHPGFRPAAWRPTAAWRAGSYELTVEVDLEAFDDPFGGSSGCDAYTETFELTVVDDVVHVVGTRSIATTETYRVVDDLDLETMVCCNESLPSLGSVPGILCPGYPDTQLNGATSCFATQGDARLDVDAELVIDGSPAAADYTLRLASTNNTDGDGRPMLGLEVHAPGCRTFEALDLVTTEVTAHEVCFQASAEQPLGSVDLDPTSELMASCTGPAFVCEVMGSSPFLAWDPEACTTWPKDGGGCTAGRPASSPWCLILVAWVVAWRRRRRVSRTR